MKTIFLFLYFLCLLLFSGSIHSGKPKTGIVCGFIKDEEGNPLEGAFVRTKENNNCVITNLNGCYYLRLSPGEYTLIISANQHLTRLANIKITGRAVLKKDFISPEINKQFNGVPMPDVYANIRKPVCLDLLLLK